MPVSNYSAADYLGALQALLPRGRVWPRDPDAAGTLHSFSAVNFTNFAATVRDFVCACKSVIAGQSTTLPAERQTIA
jgi:hypothetical protein